MRYINGSPISLIVLQLFSRISDLNLVFQVIGVVVIEIGMIYLQDEKKKEIINGSSGIGLNSRAYKQTGSIWPHAC